MAATKNEFELAFTDEKGELLGASMQSVITSEMPLPVPCVGDEVQVGGIEAKVAKRDFKISVKGKVTKFAVRVFCSAGKKPKAKRKLLVGS